MAEMGQWENLQLLDMPPELEYVIDQAVNLISNVQSGLDAIIPPLQMAINFITEEGNPLLSLLQAIVKELRETLQELADASIYWMVLHPWTGDVGTIGESNPYLLELRSNAFITHLQASLTDVGDLARPLGEGMIVVLAAGATHPTGFTAALEALTAIFDLQELKTLTNRIKALETIQYNDRPQYTPPSMLPDWQNAGRLHTLIPPLGTFVLQADAILESFEQKMGLAAETMGEVQKTLNKKIQQINKASQALEALKNSLKQDFGNVHLFINEGPFSGSIINGSGFPMNYRYCAGIAIAANKVDLKPLQLLLGKLPT